LKHSGDTGWQGINQIVGGDEYAKGQIEMVTAGETKPCLACKSWEKDVRKLVEHFLARGLTARPDGKFVTPIARDFPGRKSLVLDPKQMGFCRLWTMPTDDLATCERWVPLTRISEMADRTRGR